MIRLSDIQECFDPHSHPLGTKLSVNGLIYTEKDVVSSFFDPEMIDWDSDSEVDLVKSHYCHTPTTSHRGIPSPIDEPRPVIWDDLDWGVRWIIIKILNGNNRFAKVVSMLLRLNRPQVHEFVSIYTAEYLKWQVYEQRIVKINWQDLVAHASETKTSVADMIHDSRPLLSTDQVSKREIELGCAFLRTRGLEDYVSELEGWAEAGKLDFLSLAIEWDILQDCIDNKIIQNGAQRGWIDLRAFRNHVASQAELPPKRPGSPFLGTLKGRLPPRRQPDREEEDQDQASAIDLEKEYLQNSSTTQDQRHGAASAQPTQGVSPERLRGPTLRESMELRRAVHRQFPQGFRHISGALATTLVEEDRPVRPFRRATAFYTTRPYPEMPMAYGGHDENPIHESKVDAAPVRGELAARPTYHEQTVSSEGPARPQAAQPPKQTPNADAQLAMTPNNKGKEMRKTAALTAHLPPASQVSQYSRSELGSSVAKAPEGSGRGSASTIVGAEYSSIKASAFPQGWISGLQSGQHQDVYKQTANTTPKSPVAADQLSHLLNNKSPAHPKKPHAGGIENDQDGNKTQSIWETDDEDELYDFAPKQTESDSDYQPKEPKKKTSNKRSSGGGQRKNSNLPHDNTATRNLDPSAKKSTQSSPTASSGFQRPNGRAQRKSPPRRIKIVAVPKSQQGSSDNGQPSSTGQVPFTPTTPAKNEPLFGMYRNTPLSKSLARADEAFYAWSADNATFAVISVRAHFAERADRLVSSTMRTKFTPADLSKQLEVFQQLKQEFAGVEDGQKACVAQDAKHVKFAGCADMALYAEQAEEALFALNHMGDAEVGGESDGADCAAPEEVEDSVDVLMPKAANDV
ncbi:hypothetical protein G7Z17_g5597 [Cylindrodendrum hubeiense]|uniref:Uncharacterized protein n=1 Tax=Cylindrodendrum hubeiense TaxID=595255 RepID=A0A9P5LH57_9HYPO|nr:hypothetical protein G7Z17_g5597 [Cylindrodendrum hubeiense]